jgi:hypothetical protein
MRADLISPAIDLPFVSLLVISSGRSLLGKVRLAAALASRLVVESRLHTPKTLNATCKSDHIGQYGPENQRQLRPYLFQTVAGPPQVCPAPVRRPRLLFTLTDGVDPFDTVSRDILKVLEPGCAQRREPNREA